MEKSRRNRLHNREKKGKTDKLQEGGKMKIAENSALLVIDVQGGDMTGAWGSEGFDVSEAMEDDAKMVKQVKRVLDVFRALKVPVIQFQEVHRANGIDFGRELDGAEGPHLKDDSPYTDYAHLTYPIEGEYKMMKRRYSCFFGTDLEILLKGLKECPNSREIRWELLFTGEQEDKRRWTVDFSVIKCWVLEMYRKPGDFTEEKRKAPSGFGTYLGNSLKDKNY